MKKSIYLSLIIGLVIIFNIKAQTIKGIVVDQISNEPVSDAYVFLKNTDSGTHTNKKGRFSVKLSQNNHNTDTLMISHISYRSILIADPGKNVSDTIFLTRKSNILSEVEIMSNKKLKKRLQYKKLASLPKSVYSFGTILKDGKIWVMGGDLSYEVDAFEKAIEDYPQLINEMDPYNSFYETINMARKYSSFLSYNDEIFVYDIAKDQWTSEPLKVRKRAYHNVNLVGEKAYIIGGKRLSDNRLFEYLENKIEVFDLQNKAIETDKTNPHQAINFTSVTYKDNLIVIGGSVKENRKEKKEFTDKVHLYDTKKGLWYDLAGMPSPKETCGVLVGEKIYLIGGYNNKVMNKIESYDLQNGKWKIEGELFNGTGLPAVTQHNKKIYFFEDQKLNIYDTQSRVLKQYLVNLPVNLAKMHYAEGKLIILGGMERTQNELTPLNGVYSIDLSEFENTRIFKIKKL